MSGGVTLLKIPMIEGSLKSLNFCRFWILVIYEIIETVKLYWIISLQKIGWLIFQLENLEVVIKLFHILSIDTEPPQL